VPLSRTIFGFFFPAGVILAVFAVVLRSDAAPMLFALHGVAALVYAGAALLAWRFHSNRILFSAVALALADAGIHFASGDPAALAATRDLSAILLPANLIAFTFVPERGLFSRNAGLLAGAVVAQAALADLLCRPEWQTAALLQTAILPREALPWLAMPQFALLLFIVGALFLLARFLLVRNPLESGSFWALLACSAAFSTGATGVYLLAAGAVLAVSVVENSYVMAYHDQLTGLPARRAFHQITATIPGHYAIAVVDVDHFKRFNDTFGHDIGDQVLRMVASRVARVTGGGKAFRWGGEEFVIVFFGKTAGDALEHLELMRQLIETSSFIVRGRERRRRTPEDRGAGCGPTAKEAFVTVSIGVADAGGEVEPRLLMERADQALYAAKSAGRNRTELAPGSSPPRPAETPRAAAGGRRAL
jgi:diguanylate cyclase (GGDEF)-like protein